MITLIVESGSDLRTSRVEASLADTHIAANDHLANEARCLQAWAADDSGRDPIGWDGERLLFRGDIGDATPVRVVHRD